MENDRISREVSESLKEIVALLAVLVKRGVLQSTVIKEMGAVGLPPKRIAELLGTTSNTVRVALHGARRKEFKGRKR